MATNTILQSLNSVADGSGVSSSNRRQIETFIAAENIGAGDLVAFDITQAANADRVLNVVLADTASGNTIACVGFALADTLSGANVDVVVAGLHESANVVGATAAGDRMVAGATPGRAAIYTGAETIPPIAYAVEADTANYAGVIVIKQF